ncbi:MAG: S8 family serine peptidase [Candidatus Brocadiales bacterium]
MAKLFKWIVVFFVFLPFSTSVIAEVSANKGKSNSPVINAKVVKALRLDREVAVLIKLREESDDPLISKMTTTSDPFCFISKKDIKRLQSKLESAISRDGLQNEVLIIHRLDNIPWISGTITQKALEKLRTNPNVAMIVEDKPVEALLAESGPLINRDSAHTEGYTGSGVAVAVIDTGIDTDHPDLEDDIIREECFLFDGSCPNGGGTRASGPGSAEDGNGHGTHVSGIITSSLAAYKGIAPDAGIVAIKVLDDSGSGVFSDIIAAIDWVTTNKDIYGIKIINMSLGADAFSGICDGVDPALTSAVDAAKSAGITLFAASGNDAFSDKIRIPACLSSVISVGAVYDADMGEQSWTVGCIDSTTQANQIVCFSNVSDALDILAPGAKVVSSKLGGGTSEDSGTSMASPHAAAVAALMKQKVPSLTPDEIKDILKCNDDSRVGMTFPRIDALAALSPSITIPVDNDGDGFFALPCGNDCTDNDPTINPGVTEICNDSVDNDCDGFVDCNDPDCCDVCVPETPIVCNQTVNGTLNPSVCRSIVKGSLYFADRYSFSASAGQVVGISLTSPGDQNDLGGFDTYLYLIGPDGSVIDEDDDSGDGQNSQIPSGRCFRSLSESGIYTIEVTSFASNATGNYTLSLNCNEECTNGIDDDGDGLVDCDDPDCGCDIACVSPPLIDIGQTVSDTLSPSICWSIGRGCLYFADRYSFSASAGQVVGISLTSPGALNSLGWFDTYLYLIGPGGSVIDENDDGGSNFNSRIPPGSGFRTLSESGTYIIEVTSFAANANGNYILSLIDREDCTNGIDDDGDGFVDCADLDCPPCATTTTVTISSTTTSTTNPSTATTRTVVSTITTTTTFTTTTTCTTYCKDADGDGYGNPNDTIQDCAQSSDYVPDCSDCDDTNPAVNPGATELCNDGIDNDCDTLADCNNPNCVSPAECANTTYLKKSRVTFKYGKKSRDRAFMRLCVDERFCEALKAGIEEMVLGLVGCEPITIPGSRLKSNRNKTRFRARSSKYVVRINCKQGWLKLRQKKVDLKSCVSNFVRTCVSIKGGPHLCAEKNFDKQDREGRLKKLSFLAAGTCSPR